MRVLALPPGRVDPGQRAVDRVAELVHADALVVVAVDRQAQQVLLAEAGGKAAGAPDALVQVGRIGGVAVLGHVGVDLVLADDRQVHAPVHHGLDDIGPAGQQVRDDLIGALQRQVRHLGGGHHRHALDVEVLLVERAGGVPVLLADLRKERFRRRRHRWILVGSDAVRRFSCRGRPALGSRAGSPRHVRICPYGHTGLPNATRRVWGPATNLGMNASAQQRGQCNDDGNAFRELHGISPKDPCMSSAQRIA